MLKTRGLKAGSGWPPLPGLCVDYTVLRDRTGFDSQVGVVSSKG